MRGGEGYSRGWLTVYVVNAVIASCLVFHDFGSGWSLADGALLALWVWLGLREIERVPLSRVSIRLDGIDLDDPSLTIERREAA